MVKTLDPFAGYRLASGHPFFHIALFCASYFVLPVGALGFQSSQSITSAFDYLRWGHFLVFTMAIVQGLVTRPSPVPTTPSEVSENSREQEIQRIKIAHRDGTGKIFARLCNTLSMMIYQGTVFYAQMVLVDELIDCSGSGKSEGSQCVMRGVYGNRMTWLVIETSVFYLYVLGSISFMAWHMLSKTCATPDPHSDRTKAITDFIVYSSINLTWFAMNFVLCAMPPLCIFWLNNYDELVRKRYDGSYAIVMYVSWVTNLLVLVCRSRMIKIRNMGIGQMNKSDIMESSFAKDDSFNFHTSKKTGAPGDG